MFDAHFVREKKHSCPIEIRKELARKKRTVPVAASKQRAKKGGRKATTRRSSAEKRPAEVAREDEQPPSKKANVVAETDGKIVVTKAKTRPYKFLATENLKNERPKSSPTVHSKPYTSTSTRLSPARVVEVAVATQRGHRQRRGHQASPVKGSKEESAKVKDHKKGKKTAIKSTDVHSPSTAKHSLLVSVPDWDAGAERASVTPPFKPSARAPSTPSVDKGKPNKDKVYPYGGHMTRKSTRLQGLEAKKAVAATNSKVKEDTVESTSSAKSLLCVKTVGVPWTPNNHLTEASFASPATKEACIECGDDWSVFSTPRFTPLFRDLSPGRFQLSSGSAGKVSAHGKVKQASTAALPREPKKPRLPFLPSEDDLEAEKREMDVTNTSIDLSANQLVYTARQLKPATSSHSVGYDPTLSEVLTTPTGGAFDWFGAPLESGLSPSIFSGKVDDKPLFVDKILETPRSASPDIDLDFFWGDRQASGRNTDLGTCPGAVIGQEPGKDGSVAVRISPSPSVPAGIKPKPFKLKPKRGGLLFDMM